MSLVEEQATTTTYRQGPVGALIDEYERAVGELALILEGIHVLRHRRQIERFLDR